MDVLHTAGYDIFHTFDLMLKRKKVNTSLALPIIRVKIPWLNEDISNLILKAYEFDQFGKGDIGLVCAHVRSLYRYVHRDDAVIIKQYNHQVEKKVINYLRAINMHNNYDYKIANFLRELTNITHNVRTLTRKEFSKIIRPIKASWSCIDFHKLKYSAMVRDGDVFITSLTAMSDLTVKFTEINICTDLHAKFADLGILQNDSTLVYHTKVVKDELQIDWRIKVSYAPCKLEIPRERKTADFMNL